MSPYVFGVWAHGPLQFCSFGLSPLATGTDSNSFVFILARTCVAVALLLIYSLREPLALGETLHFGPLYLLSFAFLFSSREFDAAHVAPPRTAFSHGFLAVTHHVQCSREWHVPPETLTHLPPNQRLLTNAIGSSHSYCCVWSEWYTCLQQFCYEATLYPTMGKKSDPSRQWVLAALPPLAFQSVMPLESLRWFLW